MSNIVIDLDDTLIFSDYHEEKNEYTLKEINEKEVELINALYEMNNTIIIHTGRSWGHYQITKEHLKLIGLKYHELVMGKPIGIYIDKDSYKSVKEFLEQK